MMACSVSSHYLNQCCCIGKAKLINIRKTVLQKILLIMSDTNFRPFCCDLNLSTIPCYTGAWSATILYKIACTLDMVQISVVTEQTGALPWSTQTLPSVDTDIETCFVLFLLLIGLNIFQHVSPNLERHRSHWWLGEKQSQHIVCDSTINFFWRILRSHTLSLLIMNNYDELFHDILTLLIRIYIYLDLYQSPFIHMWNNIIDYIRITINVFIYVERMNWNKPNVNYPYTTPPPPLLGMVFLCTVGSRINKVSDRMILLKIRWLYRWHISHTLNSKYTT